MKKFFRSDYVFGFFWTAFIAIIFFLPVVLGIQSFFEAYPVLYERHNLNAPQIKTPWVIDGSTHVRSVTPITLLAIDSIKNGNLPLWSPYDGAGENALLLGGGLYNPLRLLYFLVFNNLHSFDWAIIIRFILAGFGAFLYLRTLCVSRRSALFGAIAYMFSGYFIVFITYWFLDIEAIAPFVFFGIEKYFQSEKRHRFKYGALTGVFVGLLTVVGQPQSVIMHTAFFTGYFFWRAISDPSLRKELLLHIRNFSFVFVIAALIALPYFVDLFTLFSQAITIYDYGPFVSAKHGLEYSPLIYVFHIFVSPSAFLEMAIGGHLFDKFSYIIPYFAISALALILFSFFIKEKPRWVHFYYFFGAFALMKIFGFPLVNWIGALPILDKIGWHKLFGPLMFAGSVIAAYAFDRLHDTEIKWRKFFAIILLISTAFLAAYLIAPEVFLESYVPDLDFLNRRPETISLITNALQYLPDILKNAALAFMGDGRYFVYFLFGRAALFWILAALFIVWAAKKRSRTATFFLFGLLICESWLYMPKVRDGFRYFNPYEAPPFVKFLESKAKNDYFGVISTGYTFPVSLGDIYGIRKFQSTSAIFPERFREFVPDTILKNDHDYFKLKAEDVAETPQGFFDAANLKYLVTESNTPYEDINPNFKVVYDDDLKIYENISVLPRAYLVFDKISAVNSAEAREIFYGEHFNPKHSVVIEDGGSVALPYSENVLFYEQASIVSYASDEVVINVSAPRDSVLVLTDTYYSAWKAFVDGKEVAVYPANVLFRGIYIPGGTHEVRFVFSAPWFWPLMAVSSVMIAGVFMLVALSRRKNNG